MRHYGHLVAAQDNVSELHIRVESGLALGFPRSPIIQAGPGGPGPLRVSPLDDHLSHVLVWVQSHS